MKTNHYIHFVTAAFGLAAFSVAGYAEKNIAATAVTTAVPGPTATVQVADTVKPNVATQWGDIEGYNYDMRIQFFAGLKRMEARVNDEIGELTARRAAMNSTANTTDWDFAMKEMESARSYLNSAGEQLDKATPETWSQRKGKVGEAWLKTQEAYGNVKSSTTN